MIYDFKVSLDVYNLFLRIVKVDNEHLDSIGREYSEFRIKYNDSPDRLQTAVCLMGLVMYINFENGL